jgi:hypothetical protein
MGGALLPPLNEKARNEAGMHSDYYGPVIYVRNKEGSC